MVIKRIAPMSLAKLFLVLYALIGLLIGAMFSLIGLVAGGFAQAVAGDEAMPAMFGMLFGVGAIIVLPLFYGVLGFVGGLIGAAIYNMAAGWIGGIEVDVQ